MQKSIWAYVLQGFWEVKSMIFMFFANSSLLDQKVRKPRFAPKCPLLPKSEKIRIFVKTSKRILFRSFRAPCENVALAQGILMVLGALFAFWSEKCCFLRLGMSQHSRKRVQKRNKPGNHSRRSRPPALRISKIIGTY